MSDPDASKKLGNTPDCNTLWGFLFLLITTKQGWLGITGIVAIVTAAVLIAIQVMRPDDHW